MAARGAGAMSRRPSRHSVAGRLFFLTFPVVAIVALLTQATVGYLHYHNQSKGLQARTQLLAELTAEAIAQPLWRLDRVIYQAQARAVEQDPAFLRIRLSDEDGQPVFEHGELAPGAAAPIMVSVPIVERSRQVELGTLELWFSTAELRSGVRTDALAGFAAFLLLLLTFSIVSHISVDRLVLRPLRRLLDAMGQVRDKSWVSIPSQRRDELGEAFRAFNDMVQGLRSGDEARRLLDELARTHSELEQANGRIWESIHYALTIQQGILPPKQALAGAVSELAVEWQPLQVVGGDYYWLERRGDRALAFIADCTGHGVPGAFMTLVVATEFKQVLDQLPWESPAAILEELDRRVRSRLRKNDKDTLHDDGLDAGLCIIDYARGRLSFAGASLPLLYNDGTGIRTIRGDRASLGYQHHPPRRALSEHHIEAGAGTSFYLFTDGVPDHMDAGKRQLFGRSRVARTLEACAERSLPEQLTELLRVLEEYRGAEPRRDDLAMLAFRLGKGSKPE